MLNSVSFYSLIPNDENRGLDGLRLRGEYEAETGKTISLYLPCTLLEMLVALADRMAFITFDPERGSEPNLIPHFWELIRNLGLSPNGNINNEEIIHNLLERNYTPSGDGGLFPLGTVQEDQRYVEIWYQMMAYIEERLLF